MWRRHDVCHRLETTQYYLFDVYSTYLNGYLVKLTREISIRYVPSIVTQCHHLLHICSNFEETRVPLFSTSTKHTQCLLRAIFSTKTCKKQLLYQFMGQSDILVGLGRPKIVQKWWHIHVAIQAAFAAMWRRHDVGHRLETTQYYLFNVYSTYLKGYLVKINREISIR